MTEGRLVGAMGRHIMDSVAGEKTRKIKAKITAVGTRGTSVLKCEIVSTAEIVYVEAAASTNMVDLSVNDYVWLSKMDDGKRNKWWLEGLAETSGGSHVPPLRKDAVSANIDLDDLADVDAAAPGDGELLGWVSGNSAWEPLSSGGVVNGVTKTVRASGGDYTTIQAAINYFKNKTLFGACVIDVEAGTYDEKLDFSNIQVASGATLTLQGDTRTVVGLTYVGVGHDQSTWAASTTYSVDDEVIPTAGNETGLMYVCTSGGNSDSTEPTWGTTIGGTTSDSGVEWTAVGIVGNQGGVTNGGEGFCTLDKSGANGLSIYTWTTAPDFDTAGIVNGDKVLVYDDTPTVAEYTVNQVNAALDYVLDLTTTSPTMTGDSVAACILPNRRLEPTSAGPCITVTGVKGIVIDGFYLESHTGADCDGIRVEKGGLATVYRTCAKCEDIGFRALQGYSTILFNTGATSAWSCSYGFAAATATNVDARYGLAIDCTQGFYADYSSVILALYTIAGNCTTGYLCQYQSVLNANGAAARGCTTGYRSAYNALVAAFSTDDLNYGNTTDYSPAPSVPGSAEGNNYGVLYAS